MAILEELIKPLTLRDFYREYLFKSPCASPSTAERFRDIVSWDLLGEIFAKGHGDSWLPKKGRLPEQPELATGHLTMDIARKSFAEGRTILIRHAEQAHLKMQAIASDFHDLFGLPIDIQLYCTPASEEGFDWHYDLEEVFVIQASGQKEFRLRRNRVSPPPDKVVLPKEFDVERECIGPEIRCLLHPGDWLYIPAGWWHKAQALTDSFHLSVGVMAISLYRAQGMRESTLASGSAGEF